LHATMLYLMGIDHEKLTFKFQGRDFRLTDVSGKVVQKLLARSRPPHHRCHWGQAPLSSADGACPHQKSSSALWRWRRTLGVDGLRGPGRCVILCSRPRTIEPLELEPLAFRLRGASGLTVGAGSREMQYRE